MPYIKQDDREHLDEPVDALADLTQAWFPGGSKDGPLNYVITRLLCKAMELEDPSYTKLERCVGILECAKLELYRRMAAPYEDKKAAENGEVYP